jgi:hypothetical protein
VAITWLLKIKGRFDMENYLRPASALIVIFIFVCLYLMGQSAATPPGISDPLYKIKEFHSGFISHDQKVLSSMQPHLSDKWMHAPGSSSSDLMPRSLPLKQQIAMDRFHPVQQVQNMYALNANTKRDIVFDDTQNGDPMKQYLKNSMNIVISGKGPDETNRNDGLDENSDGNYIEKLVDGAVSPEQRSGSEHYEGLSDSPAHHQLGNYMSIDVSDINVKAINTVEGGSAVATSNIEIRPVQIITYPPEAEEKLK